MKQRLLVTISLLATTFWGHADNGVTTGITSTSANSKTPLVDAAPIPAAGPVTKVTAPNNDIKDSTSRSDAAPLDYESSEQISEDRSVSFPADI